MGRNENFLWDAAKYTYELDEELINNAVLNILTLKFKLGLFENPYTIPEDIEKLQNAISDVEKDIPEDELSRLEELKRISNNGWIPCSCGVMPKCGEFDIKAVWVTMHRKGVDFCFTKINFIYKY